MSAAEVADDAAPAGSRRTPAGYGTIVIVGGGCYGSYYVRQLRRAHRAGALHWERLIVVDRDPACQVALAEARGEGDGAALEVMTAEWGEFFDHFLGEASAAPATARRDAIVPSPLMPHLLSDWLLARARARWPGRAVATRPLPREPSTPWQRAAPDGTHFVSFAEWMCPINCIEPPLCPEIRGPRTWSMPSAVRAYVEAERARGRTFRGPLIFHCTHRAYGVGMVDVSDVVAADALVAAEAAAGAAEFLVGTVSHCHGALSLVAVGS